MKIQTKTEQVIQDQDWDSLVIDTYKRPYALQQQDGCHDRGRINITVPDKYSYDFERDAVPENVNDPIMGVSFKAWLARDPKQLLSNPEDQLSFCLDMWWERNFYPHISMIINDLYAKGLLEAGEYSINIDW